MPDHRKRIATELDGLVKRGQELLSGQVGDKRADGLSFGLDYQAWYSEALPVVQQLQPERYEEFRTLYRLDKPAKNLDVVTYSINDYIHGTGVKETYSGEREAVFDVANVALGKLGFQVNILNSAKSRLSSLLTDIRGTLEASLLDDELETAEELLGAKHLRSAGVIAGVALERHLASVIASHQIAFRKKRQIGNLNDALKEAKLYDVARWRQIQRFADIRNLCGHDGEREPSAEEVSELIAGTQKTIATVF